LVGFQFGTSWAASCFNHGRGTERTRRTPFGSVTQMLMAIRRDCVGGYFLRICGTTSRSKSDFTILYYPSMPRLSIPQPLQTSAVLCLASARRMSVNPKNIQMLDQIKILEVPRVMGFFRIGSTCPKPSRSTAAF